MPAKLSRAETSTRTAHRAAEVQRRFDAGEKLAEIAAALGVSRHAVARYRVIARRAAGIPKYQSEEAMAATAERRAERPRRKCDKRVWMGLAPRKRTTVATGRSKARAAEAVGRLRAGERSADIASAMGVSRETVLTYQRAARIAAGQQPGLRRFTETEKAEMRRMGELGMRPREIGDALGLDRRRVQLWLRDNAPIERRWFGLAFTEEDRADLRARMIAGEDRSARQLVSRYPHSEHCVRTHILRLRMILIAEDLLPRCECGEHLYHPLLCSAQAARASQRGLSTVTPQKRRRVRKALLAGERVINIPERVGLTIAQVARVQHLDLSDRDRDRRRIVKGMEKPRVVPAPAAPLSASDLYQDILHAVPVWLSPDQRDDVASDVYAAVLEKRVRPHEVVRVAKHFAQRFAKQFNLDRWSMVASLDEALGEDDDRTMHGAIGDDSMATSLDEIALADDEARP